jgi:hypothetical protein
LAAVLFDVRGRNSMAVLVIATLFALAAIGLSARANSHLRQEERLPMQWLLSRSEPLSKTIVWSATRPLALSFMPFLTICSLTLFSVAALAIRARPGQEGLLIPTLLAFGSILITVQMLHLWMIAKTLGR